MIKQDNHVFQGMKRGYHQIKQDPKFLWDARNIRFTTNKDENTFLSITNEKGTKDTNITFEGQYRGHCIVGDYLIVFIYNSGNLQIYRMNGYFQKKELIYEKPTDIYTDIIKTIGVYENEYIQKVYWLENGKPKVINIVADKLNNTAINTNPIVDFIPTLNLNENVNIVKDFSFGEFSSGVIQYAFSYYIKYGQESNIFYTTNLYHISQLDRGGNPEEKNICNFNITINNIDTRFDYIRVYSILRTSYNTTPTVKVVSDIKIDGTTANLIDDGLKGYIIEPTRLMFVGGESIFAGCFGTKDNTLFLGDIKYERENISTQKSKITGSFETNRRTVELDVKNIKGYHHENQLALNDNTATFKTRETYRFGVQFQHESGRWSEPIFIKDYVIDTTSHPIYDAENNNLNLVEYDFILSDSTKTLLNSLNYKKARGLMAIPENKDRSILAQGVLCPTVFSASNRMNNSPFAQSSWFFRPMSTYWDNKKLIEKGAIIESKHLEPLIGGDNRGAEIQNMQYHKFKDINDELKTNNNIDYNTFFIDQSILTFHSPDIEFNTSIQQELQNSDCYLHIVGVVPFRDNYSDISIQTSSPTPYSDDLGFYHKSLLSNNYSNRILSSGLFYQSHIIDNSYEPYHNDTHKNYAWMIYPWHKNGSLNNDIVRPTDKGTRTSVLKRKVISNLRFSDNTYYYNQDKNIWISDDAETDRKGNKDGITRVQIFNSNEVSLLKINNPSTGDNINYFGNVDTLITTRNKYPFYLTSVKLYDENKNAIDNEPFTNSILSTSYKEEPNLFDNLKYSTDPVRIKYKSSPHAVFAFNVGQNNNKQLILPKLPKQINLCNQTDVIPYWIENNPIVDTIKYAQIVQVANPTKEMWIAILNQTYTEAIDGELAACTALNYEGKGDYYIDLYKYNDINQTWEYVDLWEDDVNDVYKLNKSYYKVINDDGNYLLKKQEFYFDGYLQETIEMPGGSQNKNAYLYIAELVRKEYKDVDYNATRYGGTTDEALRNNLWIPVGEAVSINDKIPFKYGDTYYQRYDCLKTYSYTNEDTNSIIDIASFLCETRTNIDGRYDRNRGLINNLNVSNTNFNLWNEVYNQLNNYYNYRILDNLYYKNISFPSQIMWSLPKTNAEDIDSWTNLVGNSLDLDNKFGTVNVIESFNDNLFAFQDRAISQILYNTKVQIAAGNGLPIELANNNKIEGTRIFNDTIGCSDTFALTKSPLGIYFIDYNTRRFYLFNNQLNDLTDTLGIKWWLNANNINNKYNYFGGFKLNYDYINKNLYLFRDNKDTLCYSEELNAITSFFDYQFAWFFNFNDKFMSICKDSDTDNAKIYFMNEGDYNNFYGKFYESTLTFISNEDSYYNKIFDTIEYKMDVYDAKNVLQHNDSFDWIRAYNEYQDTEKKTLTQNRISLNDVSLRKKFRVWRAQIPRVNRERIRNPWTAIKLGFNKEGKHFILHDISTKYTI